MSVAPPQILLAEAQAAEIFDTADAAARRIHAARAGKALTVTAGHASTGSQDFAGVLVWLANPPSAQAASGRAASDSALKSYLGFVTGTGLDTPAQLLAALGRTRTPQSAGA